MKAVKAVQGIEAGKVFRARKVLQAVQEWRKKGQENPGRDQAAVTTGSTRCFLCASGYHRTLPGSNETSSKSRKAKAEEKVEKIEKEMQVRQRYM